MKNIFINTEKLHHTKIDYIGVFQYSGPHYERRKYTVFSEDLYKCSKGTFSTALIGVWRRKT